MNSKFGLVYLIKCLTTAQNYVGSTNEGLKKRIANHTSHCNRCISRKIIKYKNYEVIILEENISDEDLLVREQYWMDHTENLINKKRAIAIKYDTEEERLEADKLRANNRRAWARNFGDPVDNCQRTTSNNLLLISMDLFD
tara:strand:+ start:130 stop:552 length:423 start_codon:yes stop_codon:yes gene_type:complete